jgi:histidine triad (HIT) family protein
MENCIFCKIAKGEIPSENVYEDDMLLAFKDIHPEAPVHIVIIPKKHIDSVNTLEEQDSELISQIFLAIKKIAVQLNIADSGYRVITNIGEDGGQTIHHIHFHLIGGRRLSPKVN